MEKTKSTPQNFIWPMLGGLVLAVFGLAVMIGNWPGTSTEDLLGNGDPLTFDTGNEGAVTFGLIVLAVGQMIFLLYTIGLGVWLGVTGAKPVPDEPPTTAATA
jgi:hypothetical protein